MKTYYILVFISIIMVSCTSKQKPTVAADAYKNDKNNKAILGNGCLKNASLKLAKAKLNLNKLDSIYAETRTVLDIRIDSLNQLVKSVVCGAVREQAQIRVNKNKVKELNKAYEAKFREFIADLKNELKAVADCKVTVGEENWYNEFGYVHYQDAIKKNRIK